jgi:GT2 family glycosyltransferase
MQRFEIGQQDLKQALGELRGMAGHGLVRDPLSLAVIIVTYNSAEVLPGLLDSLSAGCRDIDELEIIVVDNDSRDCSVELARAHPVGARVIETGRNAGYAAAINAATATVRRHSDVLVLNPDIRLMPGAARTLCEQLADLAVGIAVPQMMSEDGHLAPSIRREPSLITAWTEAVLGGTLAARLNLGEVVKSPALYREGGPVEWATGAALMISARARLAVGDWDESFFLYSEEVDYLRRVRECRLSVVYVPQAKAVHFGGDYESSPFLSGLMTANRIGDYARRHGRLATAAFRLALIVGEAMRSGRGPSHRAALRAALRPQGCNLSSAPAVANRN